MILESLVSHYEYLLKAGEISPPGWTVSRISWGLEIGEEGELLRVISLKVTTPDGKKLVPCEMTLPAPVKRSANIRPNFLWDNATYLLGLDANGDPKRAIECFQGTARFYKVLLTSIDAPEAKALLRFFRNWDPEKAAEDPLLAECMPELLSGRNLTFLYKDQFVSESNALRAAWQAHYDTPPEGEPAICLVTGEAEVPMRTHPFIKGVRGAQSTGAALVTFNADAFCSYGKTQNLNAPVGAYASFAYTCALNHLLADRAHTKVIGNTTVVYWSETGSAAYQDAFSSLLFGGEDTPGDALDGLMRSFCRGDYADYDGMTLDPDTTFYILGLSPNASRLSVRFFCHDTFGDVIRNLEQHYRDISIVSDGRNKLPFIPLWLLLRETASQKSSDKSPIPTLAGDMFDAIMNGTRYPETMYQQVMLRIRAERGISRAKAAMIKGYLLRNTENSKDRDVIKEVCTLSLNPDSNYTPYVLGRLFSLLATVQDMAQPGLNSGIRDKFGNSACATPAAVFPLLLSKSTYYLRKLKEGTRVYWSKQIGDLMDRLPEAFPATLNLQEQGSFRLGYYHQTQKRYEKRKPADTDENTTDMEDNKNV